DSHPARRPGATIAAAASRRRVARAPHPGGTGDQRAGGCGGTPLGHATAKEVHMSTAARIVVGLVLLAFADLNFYVVSQYGYSGFLELATANAATLDVLVDLT